MADLTFNIDDVKKIVDPALADAITTMTTAFKNAKDGVIKYAEAVKLLGQEVADKIKAAAESAKSFAEASKDMSLEKLTSSFGDVGSAVGTLLYNIEPFIHVLPAAKDSIASFAKEATNVDVLTASFGKLDNALQAPLAKLSLGFFGDSTKLENGVKNIFSSSRCCK